MSHDDDPLGRNPQDYGIQDYSKHDQPNAPYGQAGFDTPKAKPASYSGLEPPARSILSKWLKVLTRPSVATFASEVPAANWVTTFLGVLIYAVFSVLVFITIMGIAPWSGARRISPSFVYLDIALYVSTAIALILVAWLIYGLAQASGKGTGNFVTQTYLYSLYTIPLAIFANLLALVPVLDIYAPLAAVIYGLLLTYYMVQAAHRLNSGSARWLVFFTFLIAIPTFFLFAIFLFSLAPLAGF
ncbi:MAG: hypothetical protein DLM69_00395 [Candidatus Chloroheliales bacterium]|nr:MAG: hypothetical protein DLM69_00395 [Chloroflexota bacterium]